MVGTWKWIGSVQSVAKHGWQMARGGRNSCHASVRGQKKTLQRADTKGSGPTFTHGVMGCGFAAQEQKEGQIIEKHSKVKGVTKTASHPKPATTAKKKIPSSTMRPRTADISQGSLACREYLLGLHHRRILSHLPASVARFLQPFLST